MKKALIIINVSKDESMTLAQEIAAFLTKKGVVHDFLSFDGFVDNTDFKGGGEQLCRCLMRDA